MPSPAEGVPPKKVVFALLLERCMYDVCVDNALFLTAYSVLKGYQPMHTYYGRTDVTRNGLCDAFLKITTEPTDTLVMLDFDHIHPRDIVERLEKRNVPIVAPLMFRRADPYQCCAFVKNERGKLNCFDPNKNAPGLHQVDGVGSGAIAIQRQVLTKLKDLGRDWFFRYEYDIQRYAPSEDMYFSKICDLAEIPMFVDSTIETPHVTYDFIDKVAHDWVAEEQRAKTKQLKGPNGNENMDRRITEPEVRREDARGAVQQG